jgi:Protein of unknown function (DUF2808)
MKLRQPVMYTLLTIAAIASTQSVGMAQANFKVPTHPTLSEIANQAPQLKGMAAQDVVSGNFKVPTHPTLSEVAMPATPASASPMPNMPVSQLPLSNRQNFFSHPPTLIRTNALYTTPYTSSTYEFTISLPADAGAPLKAVTIVQEQNLETIKFDPKHSKAFAGKRYAAGPEIALASIGGPQETPGTAMIVFDQPVQPGSTVTVAVEAKANPNWGGVYEFGVTAYPTDENGHGQFLGYGRINFYGGEG